MKQILKLSLLFFIVILLCAFIFMYFGKLTIEKIEEDLSLKTDIQKYQLLEDKTSNLSSRQWMALAINIAKEEMFAPATAARFYAYIASVYADTLSATNDPAQASFATAEIIHMLVPPYTSYKLLSSMNYMLLRSDTPLLTQQAKDILDMYKERANTDGFDPKHKDAWLPWIFDKESVFSIPPPPEQGSIEDLLEIQKVIYATKQRKRSDLAGIFFWHGPFRFVKIKPRNNITPAGVWQNILYKETEDKFDDQTYAKIQKVLAQTIADAFIAAWRVKYQYFTKQPSMKIPYLNLAIIDPPSPSYVSEHSTISYAAAVVLAYHLPIGKKDKFYKLAEDAKNSSLLAGINFDVDDKAGAFVGVQVGEKILHKLYPKETVSSSKAYFTKDNPINTLISLGFLKILNWKDQKKLSKSKIESAICAEKSGIEGFEDITGKAGVRFDNEWAKQHKDNRYIGIETNRGNYGMRSTAEMADEKIIDYMAGGIAALDFNKDGFVDLYFVSGNTGHLFLNKGNLQFEDVTQKSGIAPYKNGTGASAADFNNDGNIDLLLYGYKVSPRLYKNLGDATFRDVTLDVGPKLDLTSYGAAFGDFDKDGWLDLYISNFIDLPKVEKIEDYLDNSKQSNILLKNNNGVFTDVTKKTKVFSFKKHPSLAVAFTDYNNDNWQDIFVANDFRPNDLYKNLGDGTFTNFDNEILVDNTASDNNGMGIAVADYNNDGWLDMYVTSIYEGLTEDPGGNLLYINKEGRKLVNSAKDSNTDQGGWGWGVVPIDYNNDGLVDIAEVSGSFVDNATTEVASKEIIASRAYFYKNLGSGIFVEKACDLNFLSDGHGRGLVSADLDNDGWPDLVINELRRKPKIYHNVGGKAGWIKVKLIGTKSNKDGIGAKVWVNDGKSVQYKELQTSGTYLSSSELILHFGLGDSSQVKEFKILWPSGKEQIFKNVKTNQTLVISEQQ